MAIARWLYEPTEARGYIDCDVLVSPRHLAAAGEVLVARGFTCRRDQTTNPEAWTEPHEQVWQRPDGALVELHWRLPGLEHDPDQAWETLWEHRDSLPIDDDALPVLDLAGRTLHVGLHAAQHGTTEIKPRADLATALERVDEQTWREAAALAARLGGAEAFSAGLRLDRRGALLADTLGLPQPGPKWALLAAGAEEVGAERMLRWRGATGRERLRLTRLGLFPPREQMAMFDPRSTRGSAALAGAYARRLVRLPALLVRTWRVTRRVTGGQVPGDSGST